jgi:RNA polymerase sigma-70 factor (ECF subfamily)
MHRRANCILFDALASSWVRRVQLNAPNVMSAHLTDDAWDLMHARLRGFVGKRVRDPHAADDIAQEVLLRLHRNLGELRTDERLDAFAYQIARNAIVDHYRANARSREIPASPHDLAARLDERPPAGPAGPTAAQELARCLEPVVHRLPEPYRDALLLTDLGGASQVEAARSAGLSVAGMKSRVQRGRRQLRDLLAECCAVSLDSRRQVSEIERTGPCACGRSGGPGLQAGTAH